MKIKNIKKILLSFVIAIAFMIPSFTLLASGNEVTDSGVCGDELTWELTENGTGYTLSIQGVGDMYNYIMPGQNYDIEPEYAPWYPYRENITEIILEEGITSIGGGAFYACDRFTQIAIPESVTIIKFKAFQACRGLEHADIPESISEIEESAFDSCTALGQVSIPSGIKDIENSVFSGCKSLVSVVIPEGIAYVGHCAFSACTSLHEVTLPDTLETIDNLAFSGCTELEYIVIPDQVEKIGYAAFNNCYSLVSIVLPRDLSVIGDIVSDRVFTNCDQLTIYGYNETLAQTYAGKYNIPFVPLDNVSVQEIQLDALSATIANQSVLQLSATVLPENADNKEITWVSGNSKVAEVDQDGLVMAKTYGKTTVAAISNENDSIKAICRVQTRYYDVTDQSQYYFKPVYWAADNKITKGFENIYFGPDQKCTRKQMVTFLWRMCGSPKMSGDILFTDINSNENGTALQAIQWASERGIIKGYPDGSFRPNASVTRKQTLVMLYRLAGKPDVNGNAVFADIRDKETSDSYKAIIWGTQNEITNGYSDGTFRPNNACLRKQIVTFLYRAKDMW